MRWPNKKFAYILLFFLLFSLVGCSFATAGKETTQKTNVQKVENKKVAEKAESRQTVEVKTDNSATHVSVTDQKKPQTSSSSLAPKSTSGQPVQNKTAASATNSKTAQAPAVAIKTSEAGQAASANSQPAAASTKPAAPAPIQEKPAVHTVTFSIVGPKEDHSADMAPTSVEINDGDTILDVLVTAIGEGNVLHKGSGPTAYVEGIKNINEFDYGAKSGWTFKLNGANILKSTGVISVKNGDRIEAIYVE